MRAVGLSLKSDDLVLFRLMGMEGRAVQAPALKRELERLVREKDVALVLVAEDLANQAGLKRQDLPHSAHCLCSILPNGSFSARLADSAGGVVSQSEPRTAKV